MVWGRGKSAARPSWRHFFERRFLRLESVDRRSSKVLVLALFFPDSDLDNIMIERPPVLAYYLLNVDWLIDLFEMRGENRLQAVESCGVFTINLKAA